MTWRLWAIWTAVLLGGLWLAGCAPRVRCHDEGGIQVCVHRECRDMAGRFVRCQ